MSGKTKDWWMFHGDWQHTGNAGESKINSVSVKKGMITVADLQLGGPVLSTPAIVDGYVYVGTANSLNAANANGGSFYKIDIASGKIVKQYNWNIDVNQGDAHGFYGMGCTPAVINGSVFFSGFDGKFYCLNSDTLDEHWVVNLRYQDPKHNQPVDNSAGISGGNPPAAGWSSPIVVGDSVYVGFGEGENPFLFGYVYCLDVKTGNVKWVFCTCRFDPDKDNDVNVIPAEAFPNSEKFPGFTAYQGTAITGNSVWSSIAYDPDLKRLYCSTGNPTPDDTLHCLQSTPLKGYYGYGILALDAVTGKFAGFVQMPPESSYRISDLDVDIGGSPTLYTVNGIKYVGIAGKNGSYMVADAVTMKLIKFRQMLPYDIAGNQIPTVDRHCANNNEAQNEFNPRLSNQKSNTNKAENYMGSYSTAAVDPATGTIFVGVGGNNYHNTAAGIDSETTPFMRAMKWDSLEDAWPMETYTMRDYDIKVERYKNCSPPMYTTPGEAGLSYPAVVNDVVFCSTSGVSLYAFSIKDGSLLWSDVLGAQTGGMNGGYGYCMGPAIWGDYVVAGALISGRDGGVLKIYKVSG